MTHKFRVDPLKHFRRRKAFLDIPRKGKLGHCRDESSGDSVAGYVKQEKCRYVFVYRNYIV